MIPHLTKRSALSLLVAGTFFMENLDATVITPAIPAMAKSFAVHPVDLNIGVSAYMLTLGVFIPISGWAAERFGTRRIFTLAIATFTLASLACGLAGSLPVFVITRIIQGIGGAMMVPVGRLAVLRETPKTELVRAIAVLTWPALVAPVLGPPVGGFIAQHGSWPWIFWLNVPLGMLAFLIALKLVPDEVDESSRGFDWPGFLLIGGGLFGLMYAAETISHGNSGVATALVALLVGAGLTSLGVRHLLHTPNPMVELSSLSSPTFAVTIWGGSVFRLGIAAIPFLIPLMLQIALGYSAFAAGAMLMAVFAGNLMMKPMTTAIMRRFGGRRILLVNGLINAAMIAACALITRTTPMAVIVAILFAGGMTRSLQFTVLNTIAFADIGDEHMADANTLFSTAVQLSMGLGIALGALSWRIGTAIPADHGNTLAPFHIAFEIVAFVSVLGLIDAFKLHAKAGDNVMRA